MQDYGPTNALWWLSALRHKEKEKKKSKQELEMDEIKVLLRKHPVFHEMNRYESILVNTIQVEDPLKKKMVGCYLRILCQAVDEILDEAVENFSKYANGNIQALISYMYQKYDGVRMIAMAQGVPELFLEKITPRVTENMLTMTNVVSDLYQPNRYNNQYDEILTFMDIYLLQIRYNYNAITGIVNNMNGELHRALEGSIFDSY